VHKGSEFVDLDIDMVLPRAPCQVFDFIVRTGYTEKVNQGIEGLKKQRISKEGSVLPDAKSQNLQEAMEK